MECNFGFYKILHITLTEWPLTKSAELPDPASKRNKPTMKFQPYFDPRNLFSKMMHAENEDGFSKENASCEVKQIYNF